MILEIVQRPLRGLLAALSLAMAGFRPAELNPLRHLGSLTIFFCWIVLVTGIWLFIFFRTSIDGAYESVELLTSQWYLGGVMRSLHRYASDAAVITLVLHIVREFSLDRHRGKRWFSWVTGVPLLWLVIPLGITGYWLVWDKLAQYVALASSELLDWLPIFTDSMARNFLEDEALSDRFFTLMAFLHLIGLPLFLVFGIWLHVFRINGPRINPPRLLMSGSLLAMLVLSLVFPAVSQDKANLAEVPQSLGLDWFYLLIYPAIDQWELGWVWALLAGLTLLLLIAPWLPPARQALPAVVNLDNCNGCERCEADCPFGALRMMPRSDGLAYDLEAVVDPELCLACGICVGACPTATPFRKRSALVPGIDLPGAPLAGLREQIVNRASGLSGPARIMVFACENDSAGVDDGSDTAVVKLQCMAQLPPSFVDFILSRGHADGVFLAGCGNGDCRYRFGADWTSQRMSRQRDPMLRGRVDDRRLALAWNNPWSAYPGRSAALQAFRESIRASKAPVKGASKALGNAGQVLAYAAFAAIAGLFSIWPRYRMIGPDQAMVSLSFSHAGQRVVECRQRSQEELNRLPPNMRKPADCPRERHPVRVALSIDGQVLYQETVTASGLWNDGESVFYHRVPVSQGGHIIEVGMSDDGSTENMTHRSRQSLVLEAGRNIVISFDQTAQEFRFR